MSDETNKYESMRRDGYLIAADKWLEDEMWNQRDRRPPDLHDLSAFARAYRQGFRDGMAVKDQP